MPRRAGERKHRKKPQTLISFSILCFPFSLSSFGARPWLLPTCHHQRPPLAVPHGMNLWHEMTGRARCFQKTGPLKGKSAVSFAAAIFSFSSCVPFNLQTLTPLASRAGSKKGKSLPTKGSVCKVRHKSLITLMKRSSLWYLPGINS